MELESQRRVQVAAAQFTKHSHNLSSLVSRPIQLGICQQGSHHSQVGMSKAFFLFGQVPQLTDNHIDEDMQIIGVKELVQRRTCEQKVQELEN